MLIEEADCVPVDIDRNRTRTIPKSDRADQFGTGTA